MNIAIWGIIILALLVLSLPVFWAKKNNRAITLIISGIAVISLIIGIYLFPASAWRNISIAFIVIALALFVLDFVVIRKSKFKYN